MPHRFDGEFLSFLQYAKAYEEYRSRGISKTLNPNDQEWYGSEPWRTQHYFEVGEDALGIAIAALASTQRPFPRRILDLPSGSGRVTRHLRAFFPAAEIWACDIDPDHLRFCAMHFDARTKLSQEDLTRVTFDADFDLIFCGSLLTHLPPESAEAALSIVRQTLSSNGIAIVTIHGRHSSFIQRHKWKYIDDELFGIAERQASETGYGFVEYRGRIRRPFSDRGGYGISLIKPSWLVARLENDPTIRVLGYRERDWADHQDIVIFGRPGIDA